MAGGVKARRAYNSPRRQQQAAATRAAILDAAQRLFERQGYPSTTMEAIAAEAGVALKTVYLAFTTKAGLLRALWDLLLKGDEDVAPVAARPWYRAVVEERDPERKLRMVAAGSVTVKKRIGGILRVIRSGAPVDADTGALWALIQSDFHANQRAVVDSLPPGSLRAGLDAGTAADILWTLNHPDVWLLLSGERGWTPERFERWFADTLVELLLGDGPAG
ncbi:MAG TPA: helix-turn-helix domain-containing protein [Candidatus Dormibacteraeota bacterium]|nr:helix-turn-helix domain-containing protein [Candidatus Dormibacteraeota bacterium]